MDFIKTLNLHSIKHASAVLSSKHAFRVDGIWMDLLLEEVQRDENETTDLINLAVVYLLRVVNVIYNDLL